MNDRTNLGLLIGTLLFVTGLLLAIVVSAQVLTNYDIISINLESDTKYSNLESYFPGNVTKYIDSYGIYFYAVDCNNNCNLDNEK